MNEQTLLAAEQRLTEAVHGLLRAVDDVIEHPGATSIRSLEMARDEYGEACGAVKTRNFRIP